MKIELINNELLIKGNREDLLEFAEYIKKVALSENEKDHLHLDDFTFINNESSILSLIIEKE